jgi:hypothetical protein
MPPRFEYGDHVVVHGFFGVVIATWVKPGDSALMDETWLRIRLDRHVPGSWDIELFVDANTKDVRYFVDLTSD